MNQITPAVPAGRQAIQGYGAGGFRIAGEFHSGSVIVLPDRMQAWPITSCEEISPRSLALACELEHRIEVLLIGCGTVMCMPKMVIRDHLKTFGIVPEWMDTGAACRTYNVLLSEGRAVAAALIAVD